MSHGASYIDRKRCISDDHSRRDAREGSLLYGNSDTLFAIGVVTRTMHPPAAVTNQQQRQKARGCPGHRTEQHLHPPRSCLPERFWVNFSFVLIQRPSTQIELCTLCYYRQDSRRSPQRRLCHYMFHHRDMSLLRYRLAGHGYVCGMWQRVSSRQRLRNCIHLFEHWRDHCAGDSLDDLRCALYGRGRMRCR